MTSSLGKIDKKNHEPRTEGKRGSHFDQQARDSAATNMFIANSAVQQQEGTFYNQLAMSGKQQAPANSVNQERLFSLTHVNSNKIKKTPFMPDDRRTLKNQRLEIVRKIYGELPAN